MIRQSCQPESTADAAPENTGSSTSPMLVETSWPGYGLQVGNFAKDAPVADDPWVAN